MQVTETLAQGLKREYKIVIPAADLKSRVAGKLAELSQTIQVPGFRPGKVPVSLLRQRYGKSVNAEVLDEALQESSSRLMGERSLRPASQPKVEIQKFEEDADLEFSVMMEIVPEMTPMDFAAISLERLVIDVPESDVEDNLNAIAKRRRQSEPAPEGTVAAAGDLLVIDFVGRIDGTEFPGGKGEGHYLELGSGQFIPGFEDQLIGAAKGENRKIAVTFPEAYGNGALAGKAAEFDVAVKEIRRFASATIDDALAKDLGYEAIDDLRKDLRTQLERERALYARSHLKRHLLDILSAHHDFALPEGLIEAEFGAIWHQVEADMKAGRVDEEDKGKSEEALKQEYREIAIRRVKLGLLLAEIGRRHDVQVSDEEVMRVAAAEARRHPAQAQQIFDYYRKNPQAREGLRAPIFEDKVIDLILAGAKISDRKVSLAEFEAIEKAAAAGAKA